MKQTIPVLIVVCCVAGPHLRGGTPAEDVKALQGTWLMIDATVDGKKNEALQKAKLTISGNRMKLIFADSKDGVRDFSFEVDPSKNPRHINLEALNGNHTGTKPLGI